MQSVCYSIDILKKIKMQFMDWKKLFMIDITDKRFVVRKKKFIINYSTLYVCEKTERRKFIELNR